jgi:Spy/CpxP family protein refolding chaperone
MFISRNAAVSLSLGVFLLTGGAGLACSQTRGAAAATSGSYWSGPTGQPTLENLTQQLNLTAKEQAELKPILDDRNTRLSCFNDAPVTTDLERQVRTLDIEASVNEEVRELLTPEQRTQYQRLIANEPPMAGGSGQPGAR